MKTQDFLRPTAYALRIQRWYLPILQILARACDPIETEHLNRVLETEFAGFIPADGYGKLSHGVARWKHEVSRAGQDLGGRILWETDKASTPKLIVRKDGKWSITDQGRRFIGHTVKPREVVA